VTVPDVRPYLGMPVGWLAVLLVVVCALEATLLLGTLLPGEVVLVLAAGAAAWQHLPLVVLAASAGSFLGQAGGYWLGLRTGDRIRCSRLGRRLGAHRWRLGELLMRRASFTAMIAVRFVAVGHTLAPVAAGALRMRPRRFVALTAVASVVWAAVWAAVGVVADATGRAVNSPLLAMVLTTVGVVVAGAALATMAPRVTRDDVSRETAEALRNPADVLRDPAEA
jgi:membrane protein DedA with SNARE-associated domain